MRQKKAALAALTLALSLAGCGTYVPQMQEAWETSRTPVLTAGGDLEFKVREKIYCDIVQAVHDNDTLLPTRWGVQTTVDLQVDETGALNPGVSFIEPLADSQSRSLGLGGTLSSQGTREDKFGNYWNLDKLRKFSGGTCDQDRPSFHGSSLLLESQLGISEWLRDRLQSELALPSSALPKDAGDTFKQDVLSYHVKFVVISTGTINPVWKLVRFSAGDGSTLGSLNRTRTHDLLLTFGPAFKPGSANVALLSHHAQEIGIAVSNGNRSLVPR
ncbi:hypothetical protein [Bradyrhizobium sp. B117]|uniref:hypothetical protein n=1 Tax=Bradyrhizobium sp. B117 TaxID=3140246 RepID=UPI0031834B23